MPSSRENIDTKGNAPLTSASVRKALGALLLSLAATTSLQVSHVRAADNSIDDQSQLVSTDPVVRAQIERTLNRAPVDRMAMRGSGQNLARDYSLSGARRVTIRASRDGDVELAERPKFDTRIGDRYAHATSNDNFVFYTVDADLQEYVTNLVNRAQASHVAVVAMEPSTGAILAMSGKSASIKDLEYHAGFPAASLFKVVTAAAAVEHAGIDTHSLIPFRGGTYTLNQSNYYPDARKDRRVMSVGEALGRS